MAAEPAVDFGPVLVADLADRGAPDVVLGVALAVALGAVALAGDAGWDGSGWGCSGSGAAEVMGGLEVEDSA
jgi:hypothetical protein